MAAAKKTTRGRKQDRARVAGGQNYDAVRSEEVGPVGRGREEGRQEGRQQLQARLEASWALRSAKRYSYGRIRTGLPNRLICPTRLRNSVHGQGLRSQREAEALKQAVLADGLERQRWIRIAQA